MTSLILAAGDVCVKGIHHNPAVALVEKSHRIQASEANMQNLHKQPGGWIDMRGRLTMNTHIHS